MGKPGRPPKNGAQRDGQKRRFIREKVIDYLSDPDSPFLNRAQLAMDLCGYKNPNALHRMFSAKELDEMEEEALGIRRQRYTRAMAEVDKGLLQRAADGDPAACKLAYQRFEAWSEKQKMEHGTDDALGNLLREIAGRRAVLPSLEEGHDDTV